MSKRGQVTIFIIVAIVIVALAVSVYFFYSKPSNVDPTTTSPKEFIQECLIEELEDVVETVSLQGGIFEPEFFTEYYDSRGERFEIEYLCYTNEYYETCVMQKPLLEKFIEEEIKNAVYDESESCFDSLEQAYVKKGYSVELEREKYRADVSPDKTTLTFNYPLTLTKGSTDNYDKFEVVLDNNLYRLISVANGILNWETNYGDIDTTIYMDYYNWLKVEKKKMTEGTKVYVLTDTNTEEKFQFASRSVVWPSGYGVDVA